MTTRLRLLVVAFVSLTALPALAENDTVKQDGQTVQSDQLYALTGLSYAPVPLGDKELSAVEGQGITLANDHATPGGTFSNPGTSLAAGFPAPLGDGKIPSNAFFSHVTIQWFGRAAGK